MKFDEIILFIEFLDSSNIALGSDQGKLFIYDFCEKKKLSSFGILFINLVFS
jgi:hypothetical protein